ncbi:MAG: ATP12 family protein [Pseudomonadota bacterium]
MSKAKAENRPLPKRFYAAVDVQQNEGGFCIALDGKIVRTPQRKMLQHASQQLAAAIAAEWASQGEEIDTDTMPLTRLLTIALDRVPLDRAALLSELHAYGETDLLCYRSPREDHGLFNQSSAALRAQQDASFDPILAWAAQAYGVQLEVTEGIMPITQHAASLAALADVFAAANDHELAALSLMLPILGSALLVLAVWKGQLSIAQALSAARLDEDAQIEHWGYDHEVITKWNAKCEQAKAAAFFLTCNALD